MKRLENRERRGNSVHVGLGRDYDCRVDVVGGPWTDFSSDQTGINVMSRLTLEAC